MAGPIHPDNAPDAVEATLKHYPRNKFTDVEPDLQDHPAAKRLVKRNKHKWSDGNRYNEEIMVSTNNPARTTSLFKETETDVGPLMKSMDIPIKFYESYFAFDDREEMFNKGMSKVYNVVGSRRYDATKSMITLIEEGFWSAPADQTDEDELEKVYGLPVYCEIASSFGDGDFNGGDHSAFSSGVGGLSRSDWDHLKNWNAGYRQLTKTDFVKKARRAFRYTRFKAPAPDKQARTADRRMGYYSTYDLIAEMEEILEAQNQSLGNDIASKDGAVLFRGREIEDVPYLQENASASAHASLGQNPFFGLNWTKIYPVFKEGEFLTWGKTKESSSQRRVWHKFQDLAWNLFCCDARQGCWVLNKVA